PDFATHCPPWTEAAKAAARTPSAIRIALSRNRRDGLTASGSIIARVPPVLLPRLAGMEPRAGDDMARGAALCGVARPFQRPDRRALLAAGAGAGRPEPARRSLHRPSGRPEHHARLLLGHGARGPLVHGGEGVLDAPCRTGRPDSRPGCILAGDLGHGERVAGKPRHRAREAERRHQRGADRGCGTVRVAPGRYDLPCHFWDARRDRSRGIRSRACDARLPAQAPRRGAQRPRCVQTPPASADHPLLDLLRLHLGPAVLALHVFLSAAAGALRLGADTSGALLALRALGAIGAGLIAGRFVRTGPETLWPVVCAVGVAAGVGLLPAVNHLAPIGLWMLVVGFGSGAMTLYFQITIAEASRPEERGAALALGGMGWSLSHLSTPLLMGFLADRYGIVEAFYVLGGL